MLKRLITTSHGTNIMKTFNWLFTSTLIAAFIYRYVLIQGLFNPPASATNSIFMLILCFLILIISKLIYIYTNKSDTIFSTCLACFTPFALLFASIVFNLFYLDPYAGVLIYFLAIGGCLITTPVFVASVIINLFAPTK